MIRWGTKRGGSSFTGLRKVQRGGGEGHELVTVTKRGHRSKNKGSRKELSKKSCWLVQGFKKRRGKN